MESLASSLDKKANGYAEEMARSLKEIAQNSGESARNSRPQGSTGGGDRAAYDLVAAVSAQQGTNMQLRL